MNRDTGCTKTKPLTFETTKPEREYENDNKKHDVPKT